MLIFFYSMNVPCRMSAPVNSTMVFPSSPVRRSTDLHWGSVNDEHVNDQEESMRFGEH